MTDSKSQLDFSMMQQQPNVSPETYLLNPKQYWTLQFAELIRRANNDGWNVEIVTVALKPYVMGNIASEVVVWPKK